MRPSYIGVENPSPKLVERGTSRREDCRRFRGSEHAKEIGCSLRTSASLTSFESLL